MNSDDRTVDDKVFHVRVIDDPDGIRAFPDAPDAASGYKPLVDAVPLAVHAWEQPPLCTGSSDPHDGFDKQLTFGLLPNVQVWLATQKLENLGPICWR